MRWLLFTLVMSVLGMSMIVYSIRMEFQDISLDQIHYANEHAVHDAGLWVQQDRLSEGDIVFDQSKAHDAYINSLQYNLPVDDALQSQMFLIEGDIKILDKKYIDHDYIDPNTGAKVSFPYIYIYEDSSRNLYFERVIFGPSIVSVIEANIYNADKPSFDVAIQEYKGAIN